MYRQGDVLLIPVKGLPEGHVQRIVARSRVVLAQGEATGHAHVVDSPAAVAYEVGGTRYLDLSEPGATLTHEEHGAIPLPAGLYRVVIQREYDPTNPMMDWRHVSD